MEPSACCCRCHSPRSIGRRGRVRVNAILGSQFADCAGHQEPRSGDQARGRPHRWLLRRRHALCHARATGAAAVKQDYQQFRNLQFKELPAPLPVGERVIWQGKPTFKGLALRSFHIREVAIYFGLLLAWRLWSNWSQGMRGGRCRHLGVVAGRPGDHRHCRACLLSHGCSGAPPATPSPASGCCSSSASRCR